MSVRVNGKTYWYVDTICVDEIIYDVYQDDNDNTFYKVVGTTY